MTPKAQWRVLFVAYCELQVIGKALRSAAAAQGVELEIVFCIFTEIETKLQESKDNPFTYVVIGNCDAKNDLLDWPPRGVHRTPESYVEALRAELSKIRKLTAAPMLLHNVPMPTVSPLGLLEQGSDTPVNRVRRTNVLLSELVREFKDAYLFDRDDVLSQHGRRELLDDGLINFCHLASPHILGHFNLGHAFFVWEKLPGLDSLRKAFPGDPGAYNQVLAKHHVDMMVAIAGLGARRTVWVAPDGVLWPGQPGQHETPFPMESWFWRWTTQGVYAGIHEGLKALQARGMELVLLTAMGRPELERWWVFPNNAPVESLLKPDDFASVLAPSEALSALREGKPLASELVYVSADAAGREAVRASHAEALVVGDNLFAVRRTLLTDPTLQRAGAAAGSPPR